MTLYSAQLAGEKIFFKLLRSLSFIWNLFRNAIRSLSQVITGAKQRKTNFFYLITLKIRLQSQDCITWFNRYLHFFINRIVKLGFKLVKVALWDKSLIICFVDRNKSLGELLFPLRKQVEQLLFQVAFIKQKKWEKYTIDFTLPVSSWICALINGNFIRYVN